MANTAGTFIQDGALIGGILERLAQDLGALLDLQLDFSNLVAERASARPAGKGTIHISFKLGFSKDDASKSYGVVLVPLSEAITMAGTLLMLPAADVASQRQDLTLAPALKDAMLEIGNLIAAACNTSLAELGGVGWSIRSEGCQGVRADVRPAFPYEEGRELLVGRVTTRLGPYPPFELLLMFPPLN